MLRGLIACSAVLTGFFRFPPMEIHAGRIRLPDRSLLFAVNILPVAGPRPFLDRTCGTTLCLPVTRHACSACGSARSLTATAVVIRRKAAKLQLNCAASTGYRERGPEEIRPWHMWAPAPPCMRSRDHNA